MEIINAIFAKILRHSFKNATAFLSNLGASVNGKTYNSHRANEEADLSTYLARSRGIATDQAQEQENEEADPADNPVEERPESVDFERDLDSSRKESAATD